MFRRTGAEAVYSDVRVSDSVLAVRSPLVVVQLSDPVKHNNSSIQVCAALCIRYSHMLWAQR